jgi:hypothetical protein
VRSKRAVELFRAIDAGSVAHEGVVAKPGYKNEISEK